MIELKFGALKESRAVENSAGRNSNGRRNQMSRSLRSFSAGAAALTAVFLGTGVSHAQQTYTIASFLDYSGAFASRGKPVEQMQRLLIDWFNDTRAAKAGVKLEYKP